MRKFIFIIYNVAIESKVTEVLEKLDIKTYTKINRIHGVGTHSVPHLDTNVWPGVNNAFLIAVEEIVKEKILEEMKKLKVSYRKEGIKIFVIPLEEVI